VLKLGELENQWFDRRRACVIRREEKLGLIDA
jgi:hypothetical protein